MSRKLAQSQCGRWKNRADFARRLRWIVSIVLLLTVARGWVPCFGQELDETRERRVPLKAELVWENLTRSRGYLRGSKPKHSIRYRKSVVTLEPGQCTDLLVPAHELVRVAICDQLTDIQGVEIWTSNGSGLFRKQNSAISDDGCSIVAAPDQSDISVAKVWRPDDAEGPVTVAIYTSRRRTPKLLDYYQCQILNCDDEVEISDDRGSSNRGYVELPAHVLKPLVIDGPQRLRIESRLKYGIDSRQRQTFWLRVYVDGVLDRILSFDTLPQRTHRNFVDGCERLVGRREFAYLDVDYGNRKIEIEASHPVYLRVDGVGLDLCRPARNRSFDFPAWDNIQKGVSIWDAPQFDPGTAALSNSFLFDGDQSTPLPDPIWDPYLNQQTIAGLARNNKIPHSGLRAYMWMRALATRHYGDADYGDEMSVAQLAERLRERYTYFRDLLPAELNPDSQPGLATFVTRAIRAPSEKATETIVGEQHVTDALGWFDETQLVRVGEGRDCRLVYRLPDSLGSSVLRLIVDQTHLQQGTRLMMRYDGRAPIELVVQKCEGVDLNCLVPTRAEAALASLASIHGPYDSGLFGGPFAMRNTPLPLINAATAELIKPADVSRVEIWLSSDSVTEARIGLQYLDARKVELSESSFFGLKKIETEQVNAAQPDPNSLRFVEQELGNDSSEIDGLFKAYAQLFAASIHRSEQLEPPLEIHPAEVLSQKLADVDALTRDGQWAAAIELLSEVINHSEGKTRSNAILARADALENAAEFFLADRERRGWFILSDDADLKQGMFDQLMRQAEDDEQLQEMFAVVAAIENPQLSYKQQLARTLMNNGRYREALISIPTFEPNDENGEVLLRCSFQAQWWQLFDRSVRKLQSGEEKNFWQGLQALQFGKYQHAQRLLRSGGKQAEPWLRHWQQGHEIFARLTNADAGTRLKAIGDWEAWQAGYPGPRRWETEKTAIKVCAGTATVRSASRDLTSQYYLARKHEPASIAVHGPKRIRIEVRPLHPRNHRDPIQDWLLIYNASQTDRLPIADNYVAQSLSIDGNADQVPGQLFTTDIDLPAGLNKIDLVADRSDILFRVLGQNPEIRLPVLPPINESTIAAVVQGKFGQSQHSCETQNCDCKDCVRLICLERECKSISLGFLAPCCNCGELGSAVDCFDKLSFGAARDWEGRVKPQDFPFVIDGVDLIYRQALDAAFAADPNSQSYEPTNRLRHVVELEDLARQHPRRHDLQQLLANTTSGASWKSFSQFDSRAGVYSTELYGWQPETPATRIRKSLMAEHHAEHWVVTGDNHLIFQVADQRPTEFVVSLQCPQIGFVPQSPTRAIIKSGLNLQEVSLEDAFVPTLVRTELAAGPHQLEIGHAEPLVNHYLAIDVKEQVDGGGLASVNESTIRPLAQSRTYQVATHDEPIQISVAGPTLLRVDTLRNGRTTTEIFPVQRDLSIVLQPAVGETGLYRIFELEFDDQPLPVYRPEVAVEESREEWADQVVPAVYLEAELSNDPENLDLISLRSPDLDPITVGLEDQYLLGRQELGTWGFDFGFERRRALEEFPRNGAPDQFFNCRISRYFYDDWTDTYSRSALLIRPRIGSGPTFGFSHSKQTSLPLAKCKPDSRADGWGPYDVSWTGYFFVQNAGTPWLPDSSSAPWSLGVNGEISRWHQISQRVSHRPRLSFFARDLSEDQNGFPPGELDQDIFTQYKSDHPYGLRLSDRFVFQDCLDRLWWIRPRLATNADQLVPDNLGFQVGTDQLLGSLQWNLSYRYTGYFADNDRDQATGQNVLYLDLMCERWQNRTRRTEFRCGVRNDLGNGETSFGINVTSFLNHSRGYLDFEPQSMLFRSIREERAAKQYWCNEND